MCASRVWLLLREGAVRVSIPICVICVWPPRPPCGLFVLRGPCGLFISPRLVLLFSGVCGFDRANGAHLSRVTQAFSSARPGIQDAPPHSHMIPTASQPYTPSSPTPFPPMQPRTSCLIQNKTHEPSRRQRHQSRCPRARCRPQAGYGRPCTRCGVRRGWGSGHRAGHQRRKRHQRGSWRRGRRAWAWPRQPGRRPWGRPWVRETRLRRLWD